MDYVDIFETGEMFTASSIQAFGLKTGQDVTALLAYLGYRIQENGRLVVDKGLLGTLPEGFYRG